VIKKTTNRKGFSKPVSNVLCTRIILLLVLQTSMRVQLAQKWGMEYVLHLHPGQLRTVGTCYSKQDIALQPANRTTDSDSGVFS
jgi:hypothetical protein